MLHLLLLLPLTTPVLHLRLPGQAPDARRPLQNCIRQRLVNDPLFIVLVAVRLLPIPGIRRDLLVSHMPALTPFAVPRASANPRTSRLSP
ncbi:hypothetical protein LshimejAT787_0902710 [Lyophyllum shimeji]|uniref:Secreted protein n=1 Tax=Lyophyllum shimeji TaxID=47721 RepID=A0A9P3PTN2_LYOSH|nr:hypothetical protein LshimejAT787_0902710 [Lyophyllum shimeji]